ncbi:MAG TPA: VCBS repeat-containing protein, partial [Nitrolancea sp.]|nr:VCBS repeat-containing protein [Nitrolancea sp.]
MVFARDHSDTNPMLELVESYEAVGRLWEAYGWCRFAARLDRANQRSVPILARLERKVRNLPLKLTADSANLALAIDLSGYPLPEFRNSAWVPPQAVAEQVPESTPAFRNDARAAGLRFRYFNGTEGSPQHRMFEFTGGGIGALDFDLDGYTDLYFTQGRPWPPDGPSSQFTDHLYRNLDGRRFVEVTQTARIAEDGFGQGVSVGDFDADGFADIFVGNIGGNQLWRNNGDGTFSDATSAAGITGDDWTTSCALVDLDGDGLSDIYAVSYVTGEDAYDRVCRHNDGAPKLCMPFDFHGQRDRVWRNDGNGEFREVADELLSVPPDGMGLGIAVWDAHGHGQLSVLVANDTTPNFFFVPERTEKGRFRLRECGVATGLALNGEGKATGCMGIALGDVNGDAESDVHITNFYAESNTLYLSRSGGFFDDQTRAMGLYEPSLNMLGFGTQFLDADLDGRLELFVANGHVDDLSV